MSLIVNALSCYVLDTLIVIMLVVKTVNEIPELGIEEGQQFRFYIVDAHHHMGREKGHQNTPSSAYQFFNLLWFEIKKKAQELLADDKLLFEPVTVEPTLPAQSMYTGKSHWIQFNQGWLIDRTIVFPFTDDYSKSGFPTHASFHVSNEKIVGWTTRAPYSIRLIGFARVDPLDEIRGRAGLAIEELQRAIQLLGLRGLKLHPIAQLFLEEINAEPVLSVVRKAAELKIPILFDTRNAKTIERIQQMVKILRTEHHNGNTNVPQIILGHCGMAPSSSKLYNALSDPFIFGETSTLHGKDVPLFLKLAARRIHDPYADWSDKILFGTDYSFLTVQAAEFILHLLSRDFPGTLVDIQKILGGNALALVGRPIITSAPKKDINQQLIVSGQTKKLISQILKKIIKLVVKHNWRLLSFDPMIPPKGTWPDTIPNKQPSAGISQNSFILSLRDENDKELHLWLQAYPAGYYGVAVLGTKSSSIFLSLENALHSKNMISFVELNKTCRIFGNLKELFAHLQTVLLS